MTEAQYNLALLYYTGRGTTKDAKKAAEWYRRAADAGHPEAQYNLGLLYMEGEGVERDYDEAMSLFERSAAQGVKDAKDALRLVKETLSRMR